MASKRDSNLNDLAHRIERVLRDIRIIMRRPLEAEFSRGELTGPQRGVMQAVFQSNGISLKELCARVGLAHSTVSGIVDRLEARGLLSRTASENDRRLSVIAATAVVRNYMANEAPGLTVLPLVRGLSKATSAERAVILRGLDTLKRLLEPTASRAKHALHEPA
jgi:DNA-binding MarR family transcriptional regulator